MLWLHGKINQLTTFLPLPTQLITCFILGLLGIFLTNFYTPANLQNHPPSAHLAPPHLLSKWHFGLSGGLGTLFWLRFLQDSSYCEKNSPAAYNPGTSIKEVLSHKLSPSRCHLGWSYKMLHLITDLLPSFRLPHYMGSEMLSVAIDDRIGAHRIYQKAVERYPTFWPILASAAYHELFEMQDAIKARQLLLHAARHGGPPSLVPLAASIYEHQGQRILAQAILQRVIEENPNTDAAQQAKAKLDSLLQKISVTSPQKGLSL